MPRTTLNALLILSYLILKPPYGNKNDLRACSESSLPSTQQEVLCPHSNSCRTGTLVSEDGEK